MPNEKPVALFEVKPRGGGTPTAPPPSGAAASEALAALADTWVPSRFNVSVDLPDGQKAVYNTRTSAVAILDRDFWGRCFREGFEYRVGGESISEALHTLHAKGFFVSKGLDEVDLIRQKFLAARYDNTVLSLNLTLTLACNLACPYCFEGKARVTGERNTMSRQTQDAVVAYIKRTARGRKEVRLVWFGGEPLLVLDAIEHMSSQLIPEFDEKGIEYSASIATNGVLLTSEAARRLAECRATFLQTTVDIPRDTKRDNKGRDTLEKVLDNISGAADKLHAFLRINVVQDAPDEFDRLYRGLIDRGLHKRLKLITIARVLAPECGSPCASGGLSFREFPEVLRRELAKAKSLGLPVDTHPFRAGGACSATCSCFVTVDPRGLLYKCIEDLGLAERAYGSVHLEGRERTANLLPWLTYDWFSHEMCRECPVLPQCAGGCPHKRLFQGESLSHGEFCHWQIRGDLENRIREHALAKLGVRDKATGDGC